MPRRFRLLGPVLLTPAAIAAGAWLWSRWGYRVRTSERAVRRAPDAPVDTPEAGAPDMQTEAEGEGARFHRTYTVTVRGSELAPADVIAAIEADIQSFVPVELARFEKTEGAERTIAVGDEYDIHISSPWDGPVRVVERDATSFTFGTREGHLEAGQIRFRAAPHEAHEGGLRFTIESWARSRDALVDLAYDGLGVAKAAQQGMWTFFCRHVAEVSGGETVGEIEVVTEREAPPDEDPEAAPDEA